MTKYSRLLIPIIILLTACGGKDSPDVVKTKSGLYGSSHGEFLIKFPSKPYSSVIKNLVANEEINMYSLMYNQGIEHKYRVDYVDYPPNILASWDIEQLFDQIMKTTVTNMESFTLHDREVESTSFEKSIKYTIRSSVYSAANGVVRILKREQRIYIITFLAIRNVPDGSVFDAFVESFVIYRPEKNT